MCTKNIKSVQQFLFSSDKPTTMLKTKMITRNLRKEPKEARSEGSK